MKTESFKKGTQRAKEFLASNGVEVPHALLLEALARFDGHRSFRAMKGTKPVPATLPDGCPQVLPAGEEMWVLAEMFTSDSYSSVPFGSPVAVAFKLTQVDLDRLWYLQTDYVDNQLDRCYLGTSWQFAYEQVSVDRRGFQAHVAEDNTEQQMSSTRLDFEGLIPAIQKARSQGAKLIYWGFSSSSVDDVLEALRSAEPEDGEDAPDLQHRMGAVLTPDLLAAPFYVEDPYGFVA